MESLAAFDVLAAVVTSADTPVVALVVTKVVTPVVTSLLTPVAFMTDAAAKTA